MMRPDELQTKMDAVEDLKRAVSNLRRAKTIASARVCFNGHPAIDLTNAEIAVIRQALCEHHGALVTIRAGALRSSNVDPSSLLDDPSVTSTTSNTLAE